MELHFCTYSDEDYAPRALVMWDSLRTFQPEAVLHILALTDAAETLFSAIAVPQVVVYSLRDLEAWDQFLASVKTERSRIDYIFTLSPCFPRFVLETNGEIEMITYLDSDLLFQSDPEPLFQEMNSAPVAIISHRFPPGEDQAERFGNFNVGWISFRNASEGRACLDDWRNKCLEWCHDREEPGRYADQKYLDLWPEEFSARVLRNPGANLALWNVKTHSLRKGADRQLLVDGEKLVFFHCHGLVGRDDRYVEIPFEEFEVPLSDRRFLIDLVYKPYLGKLEGKAALLRNLGFAVKALRSSRYETPTELPSTELPSEGIRSLWRSWLRWRRRRRAIVKEFSIIRHPGSA